MLVARAAVLDPETAFFCRSTDGSASFLLERQAGILAGILSGIRVSILAGILARILSGIRVSIQAGILARILSGMLSDGKCILVELFTHKEKTELAGEG